MKGPELILKTVAFIGAKKTDVDDYTYFGSTFILGVLRPDLRENYCEPVFFVTARHVIDAIRNIGATEVSIRVNTTNGKSTWVQTNLTDWFAHPTDNSVDVAILELGIHISVDHAVFPTEAVVSNSGFGERAPGPGDQVFIAGLFRHHSGTLRNIPIVRTGNIACLDHEQIETNEFGPIDAYLVEARSIGGLSGSPVFYNPNAQAASEGVIRLSENAEFYFFGLVHGHFDVGRKYIDVLDDQPNRSDNVNTGIAIVVPSSKVMEVIAAYRATGRESRMIIGPVLAANIIRFAPIPTMLNFDSPG